MHPAGRLRGAKSRWLRGRRIVLGVSGSIAAVEAVRIAHELIRHGADVLPVMTPSAARLLGPDALEYATGHRPVLHLTGEGEHVAWMDGPKRADLLLIAPATANTLAKVALGIDDTALTSFATVALGAGVPVLAAPAMHEVMQRNAAVGKRLAELSGLGVTLIPPRIEEEKAKIASPEDIADACIHRLAHGPWVGKKVLVVTGTTAEPLDPVRVLTNRSSGRMGVELALAAHRLGARVTVCSGWSQTPLPTYLPTVRFETVEELLKIVDTQRVGDYDAIFLPAALGDFAPVASKQKIPSDAALPALRLRVLPKVVKTLRKRAPRAVLVPFKAETKPSALVARARQRRKEYGAQLVVANTAEAFGAKRTRVVLVGDGRTRTLQGDKAEVAQGILEAASAYLKGRAR